MIGSTSTSPIRMGWSSARRSCQVIPYRARRYEKTESDQSPGPVCSMLPKATSPFKYKSTRPERMIMSRLQPTSTTHIGKIPCCVRIIFFIFFT